MALRSGPHLQPHLLAPRHQQSSGPSLQVLISGPITVRLVCACVLFLLFYFISRTLPL